MNKEQINIGDHVLVQYNSGEYICTYEEDRGNFALVKVLAVLKHPDQGDLHNPGQVEGVAFFERKALAHRELINARKRMMSPYDGVVPAYDDSLKKAYYDLKEKLEQEDTPFNKLSLDRLETVYEHYYKKTNFK